MAIKINKHKLKDRNFRATFIRYTEHMIKNYGMNGNMKKICELKVKTIENNEFEPDIVIYLEVTLENSKRKMIYIIEHQSYPVDEKKLKVIKKCLDEIKAEYHYPIEVHIITSVPPEKHKTVYKETLSDILVVNIIYISPEEIWKMLNNIQDKIENKEKISDTEALQLVIALIFAPNEQFDDIYNAVYSILEKEKTITGKIRLDIVEVVEQFNGETFSPKIKSELTNMPYTEIERERMAIKALYKDEIKEVERKKDNEIKEKDNEIKEKDNEIKEKDNEIKELKRKKDNEIKEKDNEINELTNQNENFKNILKKVLNIPNLNSEAYTLLNTLLKT